MPSLHPNKNALRFVARSSDKTRPVIPVRVLRSAFNVGDRVSVSRARVPQPITRPSPTRLPTRLPALAVARCSLNRAQPTRFITVDHQKRRVYYGHRARSEDVCRSVPPTPDLPPSTGEQIGQIPIEPRRADFTFLRLHCPPLIPANERWRTLGKWRGVLDGLNLKTLRLKTKNEFIVTGQTFSLKKH